MVRSNRLTNRKPRQRSESLQSWTTEDDIVLRQGVVLYGAKRWRDIASLFPDRDPISCCARWNELQNHGIAVKRPWSEKEDASMEQLVRTYGEQRWAVIASHLPGRNAKQCRERWRNQLCPSINKANWTSEEDDLIVTLQSKMGNAWAQIASHLHNRTDNAVKNRWHSKLLQTKRSKGRRQVTKKTNQTTSPISVEDVSLECHAWFQIPLEASKTVLIPSVPNEIFMEDPRVDVDVFPDFQLLMEEDVEPVLVNDWMTLDEFVDPLLLSAVV